VASDHRSGGAVTDDDHHDHLLFAVAGKAVVVTGGSRGIGRMIAEGFVRRGARVYISARKAEACDATAADLDAVAAGGGSCTSIPADLSTEAGCDGLAAAIAEREPALHVLVNNAGATWGAPLEDYPDTAWDKVMAVNVKGVFHLTARLLPRLRAAATADDPARVINIGSVDGIRVPATENYAYAASKAAVHMLTRQLAHSLVGDSITVNAIAPGPFESKMMAFVLDSEAGREAVASSVPLGRIGRPDDMAGTALFLASRAGSFITGAVIPVDGGISTHG
jgi:NAD(P)-dependent dehydrogenase (short-subunit alcohol dehydrogenase family)